VPPVEEAIVSKSYESGIRRLSGDCSLELDVCSGAKSLCACNQTQGYSFGVEIDCGDFTFASLADRLPTLTPQSGLGLWMIPFRGIPTTDQDFLVDLLYLDADCRVIEAVELFPAYRVSPTSPLAASVLALPVQSIFSSRTRTGDQLVFEIAEEQEPARHVGSSVISGATQAASEARKELIENAAVSNSGVSIGTTAAAQQSTEDAVEAQPWKATGKKKSWLQRLLSPDPKEPRKAHRRALPGLCAYFWTGASPEAHAILNISSTGLYVETNERWYPGTMIQMTLKKGESRRIESSISLLAKANRWGNDGVGLEFVLRDPRNPNPNDVHTSVDREELDRFLEQIGLAS
jgi:hypothetical protein